jgi:hypothetical protein
MNLAARVVRFQIQIDPGEFNLPASKQYLKIAFEIDVREEQHWRLKIWSHCGIPFRSSVRLIKTSNVSVTKRATPIEQDSRA